MPVTGKRGQPTKTIPPKVALRAVQLNYPRALFFFFLNNYNTKLDENASVKKENIAKTANEERELRRMSGKEYPED